MKSDSVHAIEIICENKIGVLRDIASIIAEHGGNVLYVQQFIIDRGEKGGKASLYMEIDCRDIERIKRDIEKLDTVLEVHLHLTFQNIFGRRVIVIGGGAQVAQVAMGAINEADRHNLRGERISVDTIPLVGEESIARAVDAVSRLPRADILVLAGALMGGKITEEVKKLRREGIPVIALNMVGSVPDVADLVVSDPVQAGTLAVMHISSEARFNIDKVRGRKI